MSRLGADDEGERMTDLYKRGTFGSPALDGWLEASHADVLAAVRRGVESGTIEGEVRSLWSWNEKGTRKIMEPGLYLVIPVDGSES